MSVTRSKYNVSKNKDKRTFNDIVFDSEVEMKFYRDFVLPKYNSGEITYFELQRPYILQEGFRKKDGKKVLPVKYVCDFFLRYADGHEEVIDIKGCPDSVAKLKRKMFWFIYPNIDYKWLKFVKKYGGWIEYEEYNEIKKKEKQG